MMKSWTHLVGPLGVSKKKRDVGRLLLLLSRSKPRRSHINLGNTVTWRDQQVPKPMDKVDDIYVISYDRKRKAIIQRTTKKRRITLDHSILIGTKENLINTENARTSKLLSVGMVLLDATLDRAK